LSGSILLAYFFDFYDDFQMLEGEIVADLIPQETIEKKYSLSGAKK